MVNHVSATAPEQTPHETETTQITISNALRRRAQALITDTSIDPQWRNILSYALEINDPLLPDLVRRAGAGERSIDNFKTGFAKSNIEFDGYNTDPSRCKIEARRCKTLQPRFNVQPLPSCFPIRINMNRGG